MGLKERREREREERRKLILDAARTLLFKKGLNATSINQIAKIAELGVATIYSYYKNKEEIFAALQEEGLRVLHTMISDVCNQDMPSNEKIRLIAMTYLRFSEEHKNYFDIINYFLSSPDVFFSPNLKQRVDHHGNKIISLIVSTFEDDIEDERFKQGNSRKYAIMFWGTLHGLIQFKKLKDTILHDISHKELFEYSVDQLIKGLPET